jgi:hypothetical protein
MQGRKNQDANPRSRRGQRIKAKENQESKKEYKKIQNFKGSPNFGEHLRFDFLYSFFGL